MSQEEEEREVTYEEILASAILNSEVIVTVMTDDVEKTKTGLKNLKAKQAAKLKDEGLMPSPETLLFEEVSSKEFPGCTDLRIILKQKGIVKIKGLKLPDNNF